MAPDRQTIVKRQDRAETSAMSVWEEAGFGFGGTAVGGILQWGPAPPSSRKRIVPSATVDTESTKDFVLTLARRRESCPARE